MEYKPSYKYIPPISFNVLTPVYDFFCDISGLGKKFKKKVLNSVKLEDSLKVVDIGCGTGVFLKIAKEKYPNTQFIGIDPDKKALAIARKRLTHYTDIELRESFAESLPLANKSIDVCFSTLAFHHMPNETKNKAIKEIYRILKPGGTVIIADFGKAEGISFRLLHILSKIEHLGGNLKGLLLQYLEEAGFEETEVVNKHFAGIKIIKAQK